MADYDDIKTSSIALVGFVGAIVLVAIIFALQVVYYHVAAAQFQEKDIQPPMAELQKATNAQQAELTAYRSVDKTKGVVAIPIDRAMDLVVQEGQAGFAKRVQQAVAQPTAPATKPSPAASGAAGGGNHAKPK
jgi:hypothetical protein